jgi:protein-S-isoprenylcysteine O-methyltransferase Ste14
MNNNDYASISNYVPGSTLGASIIIAVVLHYFFPVTILIPFPYNLLGLLIVGLGVYLAFQSVRLLLSYNTPFKPSGNPSSLVTKYLYSHPRNPIYLGDLLIALGSATILSSLSAFIAPLIFFLVVKILFSFRLRKIGFRKTLEVNLKDTKNQLGDGYRYRKR